MTNTLSAREARPAPGGTGPLMAALLRDPIVRVTLGVWVLVLAPFVLPMSPATFATYSDLYADPPMLAMVVAAAFWGRRRIVSPVERQFWLLVGLAFAVWLASFVPWFVTGGADSPRLTLFNDLAYTVFYLLWLMGISLRPHLGDGQPMLAVGRRFRVAGMFVLVLAGLAYFILVPLSLAPAVYNTWLPSFYLYLVFDVFVLVRLVVLRHEAGRGRWRIIYGALALGALALLFNDAVEYVYWAEWVTYPYGSMLDMSWTLAPVILVFAIRTRHCAGETPVEARREAPPEESLLRTPGFLAAVALGLPIVHIALHLTPLLNPSLRRPREYVAVAALLALWLLAFGALRVLKRERARLAGR